MILLDLNAADSRPIYGQIADRVKFAIAAGVLRPGNWRRRSRAVEATGGQTRTRWPGRIGVAERRVLEPVRGTGLQVAEGQSSAAARRAASSSGNASAELLKKRGGPK